MVFEFDRDDTLQRVLVESESSLMTQNDFFRETMLDALEAAHSEKIANLALFRAHQDTCRKYWSCYNSVVEIEADIMFAHKLYQTILLSLFLSACIGYLI